MTREEHLTWCKMRALEYLDKLEPLNAVTSMLSDLEKHDETKGINTHIAYLGVLYARNYDYMSIKRWIEGFR